MSRKQIHAFIVELIADNLNPCSTAEFDLV